LINDSDATSFTPLYAINHRGVQLFAAPYAKRGLLDSEVEAVPAAANYPEWSGQDAYNGCGADFSPLPFLM
jgi:hypothetical protein